ncbi:MAG: hypothetical protein WAP03_19760 [Methylorubrum rhodinum]|uniref:hypothetical protein n=1 Tax=Methylorubrum rhodinum TaxID=29428 RepID=UPI003BB19D80
MAAVNASSLIRVSISDAEVQSGKGSYSPSISGSGRFVLFLSDGTLAPNDASPVQDLFLRDLATGTTTLVTVATVASGANNYSWSGSVSDDGRYAAFYSPASNLVDGDTDGANDVFVRDLHSGATFRISQAADGTAGNAESLSPEMSGDGRWVAFYSRASNLVAGDLNNDLDVFVYDMLSGTNRLVSLAADGRQGNGASYGADISADGRYVLFQSDATNLVTGDTNAAADVFLRDTLAGTTTRVSLGAGGAQANDNCYASGLSDNGRYVVFNGYASNLVTGDTNGTSDVFLRDTVAGTTKLVSVSSAGTIANDSSFDADISADGRYVVFESNADNLVAGDTNDTADVFLRDTVAGTTIRLSVSWNGAEANASSGDAHISADGRFVTFSSSASNLVRGDTNGGYDIFRVSLTASEAADRMIGSDGADTISGLGGADILDGGRGADTLIGGSGNDTFIVDSASDRIVEAAGGGFDSVLTRVGYTLATGQAIESLATVEAGARDAVNLTGNAFANTLTGNAGANVLNGGAGADTLIGGAGDDTFVVDTAGDRAFEAAGGGRDTVLASTSYTLSAGQEIEALQLLASTGSAALDLTGNAFGQSLVGNGGANVLNGGGGADILTGRGGNDTYLVDALGDRIVEAAGGGSDTVLVSVSYALAAGQEIEALQLLSSTGSARLNLNGNEFGQKLVGNNGANVLDGKGGADLLTGRGGADSFQFSTALVAGNVDRITDFAVEDTVRLSKSVFSVLATGQLAESAFKNISAGAADANDRILYKQATGELFYDADGSGKGAAVKFAVLDTKVALTAVDVFVV